MNIFAGTNPGGYLDGQGLSARFNQPYGMAFDSQGNMYAADENNHRIRKITPAGVVSSFAGTGVAASTDGPIATAQVRVALFSGPQDFHSVGSTIIKIIDPFRGQYELSPSTACCQKGPS